MKNIVIIIKKEFKDILRDRRTLLTMIIIPLIVFPFIFSIVGKIQSSRIQKEKQKLMKVGVIAEENSNSLMERLKSRKDLKIYEIDIPADKFATLIRNDSLDAIVKIDKNIDLLNDSIFSANISVHFKSSDWEIRNRLNESLREYESDILAHRLEKLELAPEVIKPIHTEYKDVSTSQEKLGASIGGLIPYMFIIFCFMGCMYPVIDMFTGEKERGTIETLLVTPTLRSQILTGKLIVASSTGVISALLSIIGLAFGLKQFAQILPENFLGSITSFINPLSIIIYILMLIPLGTFFAGMLIPMAIYAKSYKEAQSMLTPFMFIIILPALIAMTPGIELNLINSLIPIINIVLATKDIISGTINYFYLALVFISLIILAIISIFASSKYFGLEKNILRT